MNKDIIMRITEDGNEREINEIYELLLAAENEAKIKKEVCIV